MTHGSHRFAAHRLGGEPIPKLLTGGLACYRVYPTADGRHLTVALEQKFFARLCELLSLEELTPRQYDPDAQEELADTLAETFASKPLSAWLELFDREDVVSAPSRRSRRRPRTSGVAMKTHAAAFAAITLAAGLFGAAAVSRPGAAARREQVPWATLAVSRSVLVGGGVYVVGRGQNRLVAAGRLRPCLVSRRPPARVRGAR